MSTEESKKKASFKHLVRKATSRIKLGRKGKKLLLYFVSLAVAVSATGCVMASVERDGVKYNYFRFGNQTLGGVLVNTDGSILIENQNADNRLLYEALNSLIEKVP